MRQCYCFHSIVQLNGGLASRVAVFSQINNKIVHRQGFDDIKGVVQHRERGRIGRNRKGLHGIKALSCSNVTVFGLLLIHIRGIKAFIWSSVTVFGEVRRWGVPRSFLARGIKAFTCSSVAVFSLVHRRGHNDSYLGGTLCICRLPHQHVPTTKYLLRPTIICTVE